MKIDNVHTIDEIRQFASQLEHFNKQVTEELEEAFSNNHENIDFYTGILSGLSSTYVILKSDKSVSKKIIDKVGALIAYTAKIIEDRVGLKATTKN